MNEPNNAEPQAVSRAGLSLSAFVEMHPYPFLVFSPSTRSGTSAPGEARSSLAFHTQVHTRALPAALPPITFVGDVSTILPVRKSPHNPFPDRISLGRAPNCDIVIRDPSISKLHGHFREITADSVVFTDAKSANGTRKDGVLLMHGEATCLHCGDIILFGRVRFRLSQAREVFDLLSQ